MSLALASRQAPAIAPAPVPRTCPVASASAVASRGSFVFELALRHAGTRSLNLNFEFLGAPGLPVVLVAGGISAGRHVAASTQFPQPGWWDAQCGSGRALDPAHRRVLAIDWLGSDGLLDVPIDPADQADAIAALLDALEIQVLSGFVGCSYGAMVGLQFAARHPRRLARLLAISGTHRSHPYSSAWRALQRRAVQLGALQCDERDGLALARQLAILTYRTPEEFDARFGEAQVIAGQVRIDAEDYLDHCAAKYVAATSATAFLRLSESIDLQALAPESITVPVTVVAVAEDRLVPVEDAYALVAGLSADAAARTPQLRVLRSIYGHDAFLKETAEITTILREALPA
ncbi:MAG: homoserine O-succinyltransferase [Luteimonas sp.]